MRILVKFLSPFRRYIVQLFVIILISATVALVPPRIMGLIFDRVIIPGNESGTAWTSLIYLVALFFACGVIGLVFDYFKSLLLTTVSEKFVRDLRSRIFSRLCMLPMSFHSSYKKGALLNRLLSDTRQFEDIFRGVISSWIVAPFCFVAIFIVLSLINLPLTILAILPAPLIYFCMWRFTRLLKGRYEKAKELEEKVSSFAFERVSGASTIQALMVQEETIQKFETLLYQSSTQKDEIARITAKYYPTLGFLSSAAVVIVLLYGGFLSIQRDLTGGQVVTFIAYLAYIYSPIMSMSRANQIFQSIKALLNGIEEILDSKAQIASGNIKEFPTNYVLKMEDVVFSYDRSRPVLNGVKLEIRQGYTGIVGGTGEGKTTLAMLIVRLSDPDQGRIIVNEFNLKEFDLRTLRNNVRLVMQEDTLFDGTIMDNLALGAENLEEGKIISVCDKLTISNFVSKLADGYKTVIGERGYRLSHGERQRLVIARAVLSKPAILILDEATSGLDIETEKQVMAGLREIMDGKTVIIISHRESMIENVDELYRLENGKLSLKKSAYYIKSN